MAKDGENAVLDIEVVADRPLVPQTRFGEDNSVKVEWRGRCWAWLTEGEAPALMEVAVSDREVVKLLEPGTVRRVRAIERTVETLEGAVDGLEVWMEFVWEPGPDRRATARGLWEGGKVRIAEGGLRAEINGKVGDAVAIHRRDRRSGRQALQHRTQGPGAGRRPFRGGDPNGGHEGGSQEGGGGCLRGEGLTEVRSQRNSSHRHKEGRADESPGPLIFCALGLVIVQSSA